METKTIKIVGQEENISSKSSVFRYICDNGAVIDLLARGNIYDELDLAIVSVEGEFKETITKRTIDKERGVSPRLSLSFIGKDISYVMSKNLIENTHVGVVYDIIDSFIYVEYSPSFSNQTSKFKPGLLKGKFPLSDHHLFKKGDEILLRIYFGPAIPPNPILKTFRD